MPLGPVLSRLRHHFGRIIAPDMPGHGFSDAPGSLSVHVIYEGISALLAQILDGPALFFGHSLGGAVSLRVALERPEWVDGLALLSPAGAPTPADQHERWLERFMMADQEAAREFVRSLYVKTPSALPVVAWTCRRLFRRPPVQDILRSTRRDYALTAEQLGSLEVPIRFIWGFGAHAAGRPPGLLPQPPAASRRGAHPGALHPLPLPRAPRSGRGAHRGLSDLHPHP